MLRIAATLLLFSAWHVPTTFFVPAGSPYERGWIVWPFGQQTHPAFDALPGVIAPSVPTATGTPTLAMVAAGVPVGWWQPAVILGASSFLLFVLYASPLALIPLLVDLVILWGVVTQGWSTATFVGA